MKKLGNAVAPTAGLPLGKTEVLSSRGLRNFLSRDGSTTALVVYRKEEWEKSVTDVPP